MLGAEDVPDFIISMAGMAVTGKEGLLAQNARLLDKSGLTGEERDNSMALISHLFDEYARQGKNGISIPVDPDSLAVAYSLNVPHEVMASLKSTQKIRTQWYDICGGYFEIAKVIEGGFERYCVDR